MYELSDYQLVSRDFLLGREFGCLFDSPGVGKTPPTIVAAADKVTDTGRPALITAPAYLLDNWEYEISRFAPGARVVKANGTGYEARLEALDSSADFILTSYNNWSATWPKQLKGNPHPLAGQRQYDILSQRKWAVCAFDEAHRLRGRTSQSTKHVWELRKARAVNIQAPIWGLTGTPIVNNPGDLYPLLHLWRRAEYKSYWNYVGEYCRVVQTPWATEVGQLRAGMDGPFRDLVGQFAIRRTLEDIPSLANLEQRDREYLVTLPSSVKATIAKAREEYVIEHPELAQSEFVSGGGALYAKLRQIATNPPTKANPKIDFVRDFLEDRFGPIVVYTWYKASAQAVADGLKATKRPVTMITGDVPTHKRSEMVDKWKTHPNGVLVATISSLKEGISLVHASDVVFLEHSELPADQEQCVARLKRRGQTSLVNVHNVFAKGTPDMAIRAHLADRNKGLKRALTTWLVEG